MLQLGGSILEALGIHDQFSIINSLPTTVLKPYQEELMKKYVPNSKKELGKFSCRRSS